MHIIFEIVGGKKIGLDLKKISTCFFCINDLFASVNSSRSRKINISSSEDVTMDVRKSQKTMK